MCMTTARTTGKVARCCFYSQNRTEEERVVSVHIWKTQPSSQRACAIGDLRLSINTIVHTTCILQVYGKLFTSNPEIYFTVYEVSFKFKALGRN